METWKPYPGDTRYEVSDCGRVRSLRPWRSWPAGRLMVPTPVHCGHLRVKAGVPLRAVFVHRMVLEAFVGPCPAGHEARHLNDDPTDNRLENLAWGTRAENLADAVRNGREYSPKGEGKINSKLTEAAVREIRSSAANAHELGRLFGVTPTAIRHVRKGRSWSHVA